MTVPVYVDALLPKDTHSVYLSFLNTAIHHALQDKLSPITLKRELENIFANLFLSNHFIDVWNHLEEGVLLDLIKEHKRKSGYEDADNLDEECEDVMTSVVPLEEPVQMSLRLLSLRDPPSEVYLGKGEGVSLDMLASKKVITSQVDRGKLERTVARQKRRADKRAGNVVSAQKPGKKYSAAAAKKLLDASMLEAMLMTEGNNEGSTNSRDIKLESFDIALGGKRILTDSALTIAHGRRYGLVGRNGVGKSTLLRYLSTRQLDVPPHISILHVEQEVQGGEETVLASVLSSDFKRELLIAEEKRLLDELNKESFKKDDKLSNRLQLVYRRLEEMDADRATSRASMILSGLGFSSTRSTTTDENLFWWLEDASCLGTSIVLSTRYVVIG